MQIRLAGRRIDLPESLRARVTLHLDTIAETYFGQPPIDRPLEASVTFGRARSFCTCDISVQAAQGLLVRGEGEAADPPGAFDDAAEHITRRLRRYRRRVGEHARDLASRQRPEVGRQYILSQEEDRHLAMGAGAGAASVYATAVAEREAAIATLSVGEAVMQLDLADRVVLMFRNSASGGINVVYRRRDGQIGWIDPDAPAH